MRRGTVVALALLGMVCVALSQVIQPDNQEFIDFVEADPSQPGQLSAESQEPTHYVGRYEFPPLAERDTFATYAYAYGDMVVFSYADSNICEILNSSGDLLWADTLMNEDHYTFSSSDTGVFVIQASKEFSVLSGDPFVKGIGCWFAVDQNSRPLSTKLLSVGYKMFAKSDNMIVVFSYHDGTDVVVRNKEDDAVIWEGTLDSADYILHDKGYGVPIVYSVEASKPVSAVTLSGCIGTYAPAFNGTFTGRDFMTYVHNWTSASQDLNIIPWEDNTHVKITYLGDTNSVIWETTIEEKGQIVGQAMPEDQAIYIHADKDISVSQSPWASFQGNVAFHLVRCIDRDGLGIGKEFYLPLQQSVTWTPNVYSRLHVIAFEDSTEVTVARIPKEGGNESEIWKGTLNRGEYYRYTNPLDAPSGHAIYHVTTSKGVACIGSSFDAQGSDFLPLWFAIHPATAVLPDQFKTTECAVPVDYRVMVENNGNFWDIINLSYENTEDEDFTTEITGDNGEELKDADGDGNVDTDSLPKGANFYVRSKVTPGLHVPFGTVDTCIFSGVSFRDAEKCDTAYLVTEIREVNVTIAPDTTVYEYPGATKVIPLRAYSNSEYRVDTMNVFRDSPNKDTSVWQLGVTDIHAEPLEEINLPTDSVPADFQLRVQIPDSAMAGDSIIVKVAGNSVNYPIDLYPTTTDTAVVVVKIEPVPDLLIEPDQYDSVRAGNTISYPLTVFNNGNGPDVPEITFETNNASWGHELIASDSVSPLTDTDGDGTPDVDSVPGPGGETDLYLNVTPPYSALPGSLDSTVVRATSSMEEGTFDEALIVTKVKGIISLDIEPDTGMVIGPGEEAVYDLRVTNYGGTGDTVAAGTYPVIDLGWSAEITDTSGNPITNHDSHPEPDLGVVDSGETVIARVVVRPPERLDDPTGDLDTSITEKRYVWIRTCFRHPDSMSANDSVLLTTTFEPRLHIHNYPNPFKGSDGTSFVYTIPSKGRVVLRVYNRAGEYINTIVDEAEHQRGIFEVYWDGATSRGKTSAPGVYIYILEWTPDSEDDKPLRTQRVVKKALLQP